MEKLEATREDMNGVGLYMKLVGQPSLMQSSSHVYTSSTLSGVSTPIDVPTSQGLHSGRHPRRDTRTGIAGFEWFRSQRLLYWLLLIVLWSCLRLYAQPRWAQGGKKDNVMGSVDKPSHYENGENSKNFLVGKQGRTADKQRADGRSPNFLRKRNTRGIRHSRGRLGRKRKATAAMKAIT
ncbi:uncharacterized protein LOC125312483 [Rhodamnia argentea]|uniref:Uncharacterized protein LOC125312483 n=1 Tax=Rhodamnia argentea TaxID=178133 RepID=A0ABM3GZG7_9MYRT|nr:uncharacterized protein LOC125312483 [Rhodamnia argentea]